MQHVRQLREMRANVCSTHSGDIYPAPHYEIGDISGSEGKVPFSYGAERIMNFVRGVSRCSMTWFIFARVFDSLEVHSA